MSKDQRVESITGTLTHFLIEPFVRHEHYVCLQSFCHSDQILLDHEGGEDVGDVDAKAETMDTASGEESTKEDVVAGLLGELVDEKKAWMSSFIVALFNFYKELHFAYFDINPLVMLADGSVVPLVLAANVDETAFFLCAQKCGDCDWPAPLGRDLYPTREKLTLMQRQFAF